MKKRSIVFVSFILVMVGIYFVSKVYYETGEVLNNTQFDWYETQIHQEVEDGNKLAQERLEKKYHVFVNGIFMDIGYEWNNAIYVPIRTVAESLNWGVIWLSDSGDMQLVKNEEEYLLDIENIFGKAYVKLAKLENVINLPKVVVHGGNIEIFTNDHELKQVVVSGEKYNFYINGMKMTEKAFCYQEKKYVPTRIFALSFGRVFKYEAEKGEAYIDNNKVNSIFVDGRNYATLEELKKIVDTGEAKLEFKEQSNASVKCGDSVKRNDSVELWPVISKGPQQKMVALTFDDYLSDEVYPLLDILDKYEAKATFFVIGNSIEQNQKLLKDISQKGYAVANHTWDHLNLHTLTDDEIRAQLIATTLKIEQCGVKVAPYFRPPGGYYNNKIIRIAQDIGLRTVLWSLNSTDADPANSAVEIKQIVSRWVCPGTIVTMHTNRDSTIETLPRIIESLRERGYEFVTIPEMWARYEADLK
ncbi:MAG: polysaccharide deacetylase family protein [Clostridia bacterium]|nr:polysaccharide deacetylase family protein [Clostridia bacterium]